MGQRVQPARWALGARKLAQRNGVDAEQLEQGHGIWRSPFAKLPRLVPADRSGNTQPYQRHPASELDPCGRTGVAKSKPTSRAVRKGRVDPAMFEMPVDAIDDAAD